MPIAETIPLVQRALLRGVAYAVWFLPRVPLMLRAQWTPHVARQAKSRVPRPACRDPRSRCLDLYESPPSVQSLLAASSTLVDALQARRSPSAPPILTGLFVANEAACTNRHRWIGRHVAPQVCPTRHISWQCIRSCKGECVSTRTAYVVCGCVRVCACVCVHVCGGVCLRAYARGCAILHR